VKQERMEAFHCDDYCGMLTVGVWEPSEDDPVPLIEIAMFKRVSRTPYTWRDHVRHAWTALRGELWTNEILLDGQEAKRLRDHLSSLIGGEA